MRFQFRLRTIFLVVTAAAVACAWLGHEYRVAQERAAVREWIEENGGFCGAQKGHRNDEPSLIRRLLGDQQITYVNLPRNATDDDLARIEAAFPNAIVRRSMFTLRVPTDQCSTQAK
jgi:hypothetical protein